MIKNNEQLKEKVFSIDESIKNKVESNENRQNKRKVINNKKINQYISDKIWEKVKEKNPLIISHMENEANKKFRNNWLISFVKILILYIIIIFLFKKTIISSDFSAEIILIKSIINATLSMVMIVSVLFFISNSIFDGVKFLNVDGRLIFKNEIKEKHVKTVIENTKFDEFIGVFLGSPDVPADKKYLEKIIQQIYVKNNESEYLAKISEEIRKNESISYFKLDLFNFKEGENKLNEKTKEILDIKLNSLSDEDFILNDFKNDIVSKIII